MERLHLCFGCHCAFFPRASAAGCLLALLRLYFLFAVEKSQEMLQRGAKLTIVMDDL
jgi:hypothetical protein